MPKSLRVTAAKVVANRKALAIIRDRHKAELKKIEAQLARPLELDVQVPKNAVQIAAPNVKVGAPIVNVTIPENAIQVVVQSEAAKIDAPVHVTIPKDAIQVHVHVKADAPVIPPLSPPPITFSPQLPKSSPPRRILYRVLRQEFTDQIEGIEAVEQE